MAYRVYCEWDIGEENKIYTSKDAAIANLKKNMVLEDMIDGHRALTGVSDLMDVGLLGLIPVEIIS